MFIHFHKFRAADSGYLATVVLLVSSLAEDFGGLRRLADAFGLLDESKPRRWQLQHTERQPSAGSQRSMLGCRGVICGETSSTRSFVKSIALQSSMALIRCVALLTAAFFACQYLVRYAPRQLREALPSQFAELLKIQESEIVEDKTWWSAICLSLPYAVLVIVFAHDLFCHRLVRRLTLSQIIYERHFGIYGNHYVAYLHKVTEMFAFLYHRPQIAWTEHARFYLRII